MISLAQPRNSRRSSAFKGFNTLIKTKSLPNFFKHNKKNSNKEIKKTLDSSKNLRWLRFFSAFLSLTNIILIFYETELFFSENFKLTSYINTVRGLTFLLCIIHSLIMLFIHLLVGDKSALSLYRKIKDLISNKYRFMYFAIDLFLCMVHALPGIGYSISFTQLGFVSHLSYSDMIFPFALLKIKFILVFILHETKESHKRTKIILSLFKIDNNLNYFMKSFSERYVFCSFVIMLGFSIIILGLTLRVFEKDATERLILDSFWIVFTTESTVGYGEMYPITHIGRLIAGFGSLLGVFVFSYKIVSIRKISSLSHFELSLAFKLRNKKKFGKKIIPMAVSLIILLWTYHREKKVHLKFKLIEKSKEFKKLRRMLLINLNPTLGQQITESSKLMSKSILKGLGVFKEVNQFVGPSKKLAKTCYKNLKKLKKIYVALGGNKMEPFEKKTLLNCKIMELAKNRKNAIKNLFIRKVVNSPCFSSRSLSCSSLDK